MQRTMKTAISYWHSLQRILNTEAIIVSYPKSGRTWIRAMLGYIIVKVLDEDESRIMDLYGLTSRKPKRLPVVTVTHDGSQTSSKTPYRRLRQSKWRYRGKRVIFLHRDPRDVLVSSYFQATRRRDYFDGDLSTFVRSDEFGIKKILTFYNLWYDMQAVPQGFLLTSYEKAHQDPYHVLENIVDFVGLQDGRQFIEDAVEYAQFDNMRKLEQNKQVNHVALKPRSVNDITTYKTREGKVGNYINHLSAEDIAYVEEVYDQLGDPLAIMLSQSSG